MAAGYQSVLARAVTIDELLSDAFEHLPGQKSDTDLAGRRLAGWCRASASGDWALFARRLRRDGLSFADVLARFATVRRIGAAPAWMEDAAWIVASLHDSIDIIDPATRVSAPPVAFEELLAPVVRAADARLSSALDESARAVLADDAHNCLRRDLASQLSQLCAPVLYQRFAYARDRDGLSYQRFVSDMKADGFGRLFGDKPVLLRLIASLARQWIETSSELITRLAADLPAIRRHLLHTESGCRATFIDADLSDPHNFGRTVRIIGFDDGSRVVYKPKDLRVDAAWHGLVGKMNRDAPIALRAVRVLPREGYGWTEFIEHSSCVDIEDFRTFFRRAGALLALFHCCVGVDMHQENIIAAGADPVPIDLEMILQAADMHSAVARADGTATGAAMQKVIDSVMTVGLLPAYGRLAADKIFAIGGVTSNSSSRMKVTWTDVNSDAMQPVQAPVTADGIFNLPHLNGRPGRLGDHIGDFLTGFADYAQFLKQQRPEDIFDDLAGLPIRTVVRPTRFYYLLLQRLRDHRSMTDGVMWSAQADFVARLADWESDTDPAWPVQRLERVALQDLNVPHFVAAGDVDRARARLGAFDDDEIAWQTEIIRQNTDTMRRGDPARRLTFADGPRDRRFFVDEADRIVRTLSEHAVRAGDGAAWIGLDWLGDSEVSQLVVLGPELYNGVCGIAVFLAAHAAVTRSELSAELALAAIATLRETLRGRNPALTARSLGLGAGLGLGSIVYALAVIAEFLDDEDLLADAHVAAELITGDVVSADRQLDVLCGSAGAILGLLRLYRQAGSDDALQRAAECGRHLLAQPRVGADGCRSWTTSPSGIPLNGMSHGAAGFAYSLAALASATGADEFSSAAGECLAFENSTFDAVHANWPDLEGGARAQWPSKWCHGAPGIGLARIAIAKSMGRYGETCRADVRSALAGVEHGWPGPTDTLCCGTLGSIEFWCEAAEMLERRDLFDRAGERFVHVVESARSTGDYRFTNGGGRFNLGLFRGVSGVGYTALRRIDMSLPNVLIWE